MHSIKLIHRDIKPANILFSELRKKYVFCDFGISHFIN
jgi:serine/threonine protein kinase